MSGLVVTDVIESGLHAVGRASLYGGLIIAGAWLVCWALPRLSPRVRSWIWRLVYLKLILLVFWPSPIPLPWLPKTNLHLERAAAPPPSRVPRPTAVSAVHPRTPGVLPLRSHSRAIRPTATKSRKPVSPSPARAERWKPVAGGNVELALTGVVLVFALGVVWLVGVLCFFGRTWRSVSAAKALLRASTPVTDPWLLEESARLSRRLGLNSPPRLRWHEQVAGPQTLGWWQPTLLFPAGFTDQFSAPEIRLVLLHELAHVRRHDLFWAWVRRWVNGLLFFHPLVWIAHEQATLAEEIACDAIACEGVNATLKDYAETLLKVTERSLRRGGGATTALGTGMSRAYRVTSTRLRALPLNRKPVSRFARWRRQWATLLAGAVTVGLLWVGLLRLLHPSDIQQIDPRYRVLGFQVSHGTKHSMTLRRDVLHFLGLRLAREVQGPTWPPPGVPVRVSRVALPGGGSSTSIQIGAPGQGAPAMGGMGFGASSPAGAPTQFPSNPRNGNHFVPRSGGGSFVTIFGGSSHGSISPVQMSYSGSSSFHSDSLSGAGAQSQSSSTTSFSMSNSGTNVTGAGLPGQIAYWLRKIGFHPKLDMSTYHVGVYSGTPSLTFIVRFADDPRYAGYSNLAAYLVDQQGEKIALPAKRAEAPSGSGEYVKIWEISPAPITHARFKLLLRLEPEGKDVAVIRLGNI